MSLPTTAVNIKPDSFLPIKVTQKRKLAESSNSDTNTANNTTEDVLMSETNSESNNVPKAKKMHLDTRKITVPFHRLN